MAHHRNSSRTDSETPDRIERDRTEDERLRSIAEEGDDELEGDEEDFDDDESDEPGGAPAS